MGALHQVTSPAGKKARLNPDHLLSSAGTVLLVAVGTAAYFFFRPFVMLVAGLLIGVQSVVLTAMPPRAVGQSHPDRQVWYWPPAARILAAVHCVISGAVALAAAVWSVMSAMDGAWLNAILAVTLAAAASVVCEGVLRKALRGAIGIEVGREGFFAANVTPARVPWSAFLSLQISAKRNPDCVSIYVDEPSPEGQPTTELSVPLKLLGLQPDMVADAVKRFAPDKPIYVALTPGQDAGFAQPIHGVEVLSPPEQEP